MPRFVARIVPSCFAAAIACCLVLSGVASADDAPPQFRRTTPRASLSQVDDALVIGVPGGRAWGIESALRPLPAERTTIVVTLGVHDDTVRHAFVRVAYYASATGRTRQLAIADSAPVAAGAQTTIAVPLDPPEGAVGYRVRVLARLRDAGARSSDTAISAVLRLARGPHQPGSLSSRLLE